MKALFTGHSVRQYKNQLVEAEKIELLLKAAMAAPTAGNQREWEFIVVTDPELLKKVAKASPYAGCAAKAPLAIIPVANMNKARFPENWEQDLGAAMENILIEAVHLGLGGVWLGIAPLEDRMTPLMELFDLPEGVYPYAIASIGYPLTDELNDGRDYDLSLVHYNSY